MVNLRDMIYASHMNFTRFLSLILLLALPIILASIPTSHAQQLDFVGTVDIDYVQKISDKTHILSIDFKLEKNWKIYWHSGGASALPPRIIWDEPSQILIEHAQILWAYPEKLSVLQIESLGYKGEFALPVQVTTHTAHAQNIALSGVLHYPVCADICIPAQKPFTVTLPEQNDAQSPLNPKLKQILQYVPVGLNLIDDSQLFWSRTEQGIILHGQLLPDVATLKQHRLTELKKIILSYRPADSYHGLYLLPKLKKQQGDIWQFKAGELKKNRFDNQLYLPDNFAIQAGLPLPLLLTAQYQGEFIETRLLAKYQQLPVNHQADDTPIRMSFYVLALLALLAGLLLNLMPCVLPVLSLKLLPIARLNSHAENYPAQIASFRQNALLSALGIIIGFQLLALLLWVIGLSSFVGWGAQFQSPFFLLLMIWALLLFIAIEMGWQQFRLPMLNTTLNSQQPHQQSKTPLILQKLSTGIIIAWLASSCTAPIIGTIIGAAISGGALQLFTMLALLSLGMASPYLLIATFPNSIKLLPKSGRWNLWLKNIIVLSLFLTACWLLYLLSFHLSMAQSMSVTVLLVLMLTASYWRARYNNIDNNNTRMIMMQKIPLFIIGLLMMLAIILSPQRQQTPPDLTDATIPQAHLFAPDKISALLDNQHIVIVDITARWCITCKFNDKRVWLSNAGQALLQNEKIYLMRADWTLPNQQIEDFLQQYQRYAIPFTIIYQSQNRQGIIMPELYRVKDVQKAIKTPQ